MNTIALKRLLITAGYLLVAAGAVYFAVSKILPDNQSAASDEISSFLGTPVDNQPVAQEANVAPPKARSEITEVEEGFEEEDITAASSFFSFFKTKEKKKRPASVDLRNDKEQEPIVVAKDEWEKLESSRRECMANYKISQDETVAASEGAFNRGRASCLESKDQMTDAALKVVGDEMEKILEDLRIKLRQYTKSSALINGRCEAEMKTGEWRWFELKDVCLNIVNKKVGNDGDITGVIGAVSTESQSRGILRLNCDIGNAHIDLLTSCR